MVAFGIAQVAYWLDLVEYFSYHLSAGINNAEGAVLIVEFVGAGVSGVRPP